MKGYRLQFISGKMEFQVGLVGCDTNRHWTSITSKYFGKLSVSKNWFYTLWARNGTLDRKFPMCPHVGLRPLHSSW